MQTPWMFVAGCGLAGFLFPTFIVVISGWMVGVKALVNLLSAVVFGLIAASFVY